MNNINNDNTKVPEGWKRVRLGEVVIENSKSPFKVEDADNEGSYPFFTSGEEILKHSKFLIDDENIFISTGGTAYVKYYKGKSSYSTDTYSLKSKINTLYLYYFLYRKLNRITFRYFIGSGLEHLQKQDFKNSFEVTFPIDFNEQQKIAEILETVDRAIEKTDKIIEKYKRIKQGLMQDLLTKGIDENGKIRSEKSHKFKTSPIGRIPEEWEVVRLGEVCDLKQGIQVPLELQFKDPVDNTIRFIRIVDYTQKIDEKRFVRCHKTIAIVNENDVVMVRYGASAGFIGRGLKGVIANNMFRIIPISIEIDKIYLYYFLISYHPQIYIALCISSSAMPALTFTQISKMNIPLPPLPEQHRIAEILSQIDNTLEKEEAYKQKLECIKKGLMEDLLTGKVRVNKLIKEKEIEYE